MPMSASVNMLTTLKRIVQEMNQIPELDKALSRLTQRVKSSMQVDSCSLYLADHERAEFVLKATDGLHPDAVGRVRIGFDEGLIGLVGQREEPLNIENAPLHPRFKHYPEVQEDNYNAFLGTPIIHQRQVLGVLTMQQAAMRRFGEDEEAFLVTLATQVALEISNAQIRGALAPLSDNVYHKSQRNVRGIAGSSGVAMGYGFSPQTKLDLRQYSVRRATDISLEIQLYRHAVETTRQQVEQLSAGLAESIPEDVRAIFQLYHHLLDANSLGREVEALIKQGWNAASSLKMVVEDYAARFSAMDDPYMQERAIDIIDLSNRILVNIVAQIKGKTATSDIPERDTILVAEEVSAPMLAEFPRHLLKGIISTRGSHNSHAAILARAMGVPAVMGCQNITPDLLQGQEILLDGFTGEVIIRPAKQVRKGFIALIEAERLLSQRIDAEADKACETTDGYPVTLYVNAGLSAEVEDHSYHQGIGVGLYRTEIPFMLRQRFPSEKEQVDIYRQILQSAPHQPITRRTLDVGGDKPLPYFPISEENPFLGWRGIRITLDHPDLFLIQIRAMLRASAGLRNLQIMLPMITSVSEVVEAKGFIEQALQEVTEEAIASGEEIRRPQVGIMLEVPSVLFQLPQLAACVDFFSVGSNDLTQYLLAVDRNNSRVSNIYSSYHPAVLSALHDIVKQADKLQKPVTVCGEIAGEPGGALLLMGMGYRRLSMNAYNLRRINWVVRNSAMRECQQLAAMALTADNAQDVFHTLNEYLEQRGMAGLVRAGG